MVMPKFEEITAASSESNDAAVEAYARESRVKTLFKDGVLYAGFSDGTVIGASFDLSLDDLEAIRDAEDDPMVQFRETLMRTGGKATAEKLLKRSAVEATQFMNKWFETFTKLQNVSLGE